MGSASGYCMPCFSYPWRKRGAFLSEADAQRYKDHLKYVEVVVFEDSAHALWEPDEARFQQTIQHFLKQIDAHS